MTIISVQEMLHLILMWFQDILHTNWTDIYSRGLEIILLDAGYVALDSDVGVHYSLDKLDRHMYIVKAKRP